MVQVESPVQWFDRVTQARIAGVIGPGPGHKKEVKVYERFQPNRRPPAPPPKKFDLGIPPYRALFLLPPSSPLRIVCAEILRSPIYGLTNFFVVILVCASIASRGDGPTWRALDLFVTVYFTVEVILKVTKRGFVLHPGSYLRTAWHVLDLIVTILGWLSYFTDLNNFTSLRALRILRTLKSLVLLKTVRIFTEAVLSSIPMLLQCIVQLAFFFIVFGIVGTAVFPAALRFKAVDGLTGQVPALWDPEIPMFICGDPTPPARTPEPGLICVPSGNPTWGYTNFDNTLWVWLMLWECLTMSRWTTFMYWTWDSLGAGSVLYFWAVVIIGSLLVVNLTLAVLNNTYVSLVEKDTRIRAKAKADAAKAAAAEPSAAAAAAEDSGEKSTPIGRAMTRAYAAGYGVYERLATWFSEHAHADLEGLPKHRYFVEKIIEGKTYRFLVDASTWFGCILICCYYPDMPDRSRAAVEAMNVIAVAAYAIDAILRVFARGPLRCFIHSMSDCIDVSVAIMGIIQLGINPPDRAASVRGGSPRLFLYPFRFFRLVRVARYCRFSAMRAITMDTVRSLRTVAGFVPTLLVYVLVCALFGMQLFGDTYPPSERQHFSSFWDGAILSVFRILTADRWNELMWGAMRYSGTPWASVYFVAVQAIGNFIVLNGLVAVLINSLSTSESRKKAERELLALKTREALLQGAFQTFSKPTGLRSFANIETPKPLPKPNEKAATPRKAETPRRPKSPRPLSPPRSASTPRARPSSSRRVPPPRTEVRLEPTPRPSLPGPQALPFPAPAVLAAPVARAGPPPTSGTLFPALGRAPPPLPPPPKGAAAANGHGPTILPARSTLRVEEIVIPGDPPGPPALPPPRPDFLFPAPPPVERPAERARAALSPSFRTRHDGPVDIAGNPVPPAPRPPRPPPLNVNGGAGAGAGSGPTSPANDEGPDGPPSPRKKVRIGHVPPYRRGSMIRDAWGCPRVTAGFHVPLFDDGSRMGRRGSALPKQPSLLRTNKGDVRAPSMVPWRAGWSLFLLPPKFPPRVALQKLVYSRYFMIFIVAIIVGSCITLILDYPAQPNIDRVRIADAVFTCIFLLEAFLKILAMGFLFDDGSYLRDPWNCLDFAIAIASGSSLGNIDGGPGQRAVRVIRVFRVLRPLRLIRQAKGVKFVTMSLLRSIPGIFRISLLLMIVWGFFATLGMQLFMGRLSRCNDATQTTQAACVGTYLMQPTGRPVARVWSAANSNFENVWTSLLTLFEMSTLSNWVLFMYDGMDATGIGQAPVRNADVAASVFFLAFLIVGVFAVLNWYSSIIVMSFLQTQEMRRSRRQDMERAWEMEDEAVHLPELTPDQKQWAQVLHEAVTRPLLPRVKRAGQHWRRAIGGLLRRPWFEPIVVVLIAADAAILLANSADQSHSVDEGLMWASFALSILFIIELFLRIAAMGPKQFFRDRWRIIDFVIVAFTAASSAADVGLFYTHPGESNQVTAARGLRVLRVARVFRLFSRTKSLSLLFDTFADCLPGLLELSVFFFLLGFIWAIVGVQAFGTNRRAGAIDMHANFEHAGFAALSLFGFATADRWNDVMWAIAKPAPEDCPEGPGVCDAPAAPLYFTSWIWLSRLVFVNLIAAVCIDAFQVNVREQLHLVRRRDIKRFLRAWQKYDPTATGCIRAHAHLVPLLLDVGPPLGLASDASRSDVLRFVRSLRVPLVHTVHLQYRVLLHALINRTYMLALVPMVPEIDREARLGYMRECPVLRPYSTADRDNLHTAPTVAETFAALAVQQRWRSILRERASHRFLVPEMRDVFSVEQQRSTPLPHEDGYESDDAHSEHLVVSGIRARAEAARSLNRPHVATMMAPTAGAEPRKKKRNKGGDPEELDDDEAV